jgi:tripartite-type tricarboxylate transporter receptor subunit TctC
MFLILKRRRKLLKSLLFASLAGLSSSGGVVQAQSSYPTKPVKMMVAFAPGTASDIIGRLIAERLSLSMGQSFVVENRAGAGGTIAAEAVAKSPADGYTLLVSTAALPVSASVYPSLKYDTAKDFASITVLTHSPLLLAANLDFAPKSISELVSYAKANPGNIT